MYVEKRTTAIKSQKYTKQKKNSGHLFARTKPWNGQLTALGNFNRMRETKKNYQNPYQFTQECQNQIMPRA